MTTEQNTAAFEASELPEIDQRLLEHYARIGRSVDELAYTDEFDQLHGSLTAAGDTRSKAEVFRRLLNLRKAGRLPRV